ncbi:hypothetical protein HZH66_013708 [Vespula vulgaris]|uniref:Fatty acyl-CoA reductase n=1 Tax=Vespula vulgaris TaxID=7454 RepID=A0A834JAY4_VESVU|nr:hypothetical protein HZH66_013708 [Vespula vulgaris]
MHPRTGTGTIIDELKKINLQVKQINIIKRDTKQLLLLFFIELEPNNNSKDIYKIDKLLNTIVSSESPKTKRDIPQCLRCQSHGHTKNYCNETPACVKCAGKHWISSCPYTGKINNVNTKTEYISVHVQSSIESMKEVTPVQKFYNGQSIFITGGTGCLGKLIVEKLLKECHGITCIYLLIRTKKRKSIFQHTKGLFENSLFSTLRKKQSIFQNRIVAIEDDCSLPNFSISMIDRAILIRKVLIVCNVAATVKFNETIKLAIIINVRSLKDAINLSKEMPKLKIPS